MQTNSFLVALVRHLLGALGGWLVAKGVFDESSYDALMGLGPEIAGAILVAGSLVWSWFHKRYVRQVVDEAAAAEPGTPRAMIAKGKV